MALNTLAVVVLFVSNLNFATCQNCGSADTCSTDYDAACPEDLSNDLMNCMQSQTTCNEPLQALASISVQCYSTCILGEPFDPSIPRQCCADPILDQPLSQTVEPSYTLVRLYSPNEPGDDNYRLNTVCNYNIQCPTNYDLHYTLMRYSIEAPSNVTDNCLDFLRLQFVATGQSVNTDVILCGDPTSRPVPEHALNGFHGSSLNLEFRSNRVGTANGFFLSGICINPAPFHTARQAEVGFQQRSDCMPSQSLPVHRTGRRKRATQPLDIEKVFPARERRSFRTTWIRVKREGVVKYENNVITVERGGRILHKFQNIRVLQVFNGIEGYLTFYSNSMPQERNFPGYGFLQIGNKIVYYIQTIVDPRFLLSEEEEGIVSDLLEELFRRQAFKEERFYFRPPGELGTPDVNCTINELAELNIRSCTAVVRSAADFFMKTDPFRQSCRYGRK